MAFTTRRGRPRNTPTPDQDPGTPELRLKHALGLTAEPIDLCLARGLITEAEHWCGLHLRWLYTLRYGAPSLTTRYLDPEAGQSASESSEWRALREEEYHRAVALLKQHRYYEPLMRLCIFNETPVFLHAGLRPKAWESPALRERLAASHQQVKEGLILLTTHWKRKK